MVDIITTPSLHNVAAWDMSALRLEALARVDGAGDLLLLNSCCSPRERAQTRTGTCTYIHTRYYTVPFQGPS